MTDPWFAEEGSILVSDPNQYASDWDAFQQYESLSANSNPVEGSVSSMSMNTVTDPSLEDTDFSETALFISQILMEENVEQSPFYDSLSLQLTEKSFHDALINPSLSPNQQHPFDFQNSETTTSNSNNSSNSSRELKPPSPDTPVSVLRDNHDFQFNSRPLHDLDSSATNLLAQDIFNDADSVSQFKRGLEEASKFLPVEPRIVTGLDSNGQPPNMLRLKNRKHHDREEESDSKEEGRRSNKRGLEEASKFLPVEPRIVTGLDSNGQPPNMLRLKNRKHHDREEESDSKEEGRRSNKQSAFSVVDEENNQDLSEMFDKVLLNLEHLPLCNEVHGSQNGEVKAEKEGEKDKSPSANGGGKGRPKKQGRSKETVDLRALLLLCSQAVYSNDNRAANEFLKQIRDHSSSYGDASQRLAHYFANGLEARLGGDGTGAQIFYSSPSSQRISTAKYLKAYQAHLSTSPFKKFAYFFANKMIMKEAAKAESLHIIDFGILYGFQWPILIKFLSERDGGPPKLKITGIEFPLPGFRPTERIDETGHRLTNYCKRFNVPFEYNAIASKNWETIEVKDLRIQTNEFVAVNCMMRFKNLLDETIEENNSPRDAVLQLIRKINPNIFTQSISNGSFNAPFFVTRFREALFHFSATFDMFDTVISRDNQWRRLIERESVGREAMNVIACEGLERVERPETYKRWQVRNTRAGFKQLPLNEGLMDKFRIKLKKWYHKDFVFDEDNNWMLQGWKGRIMYASTCWVPA
ncbi:scarecrow-like protein 34 [Lotus japonicus]|uniref:scarecrow-like protein 34 n=1 Tax=Lotus japonicus TaxID=34305 RepID=UPI00258F6AEF|nr:scarecrow-like protein 34 [Lotus japonicus]